MIFKVIAICWILIIIILAQLITPDNYDWKQNTISDLAAQNFKNRWLMQIGFILFGIFFVIDYLFNIEIAVFYWYYSIPLSIYALSISFSGIFSTKPFEDSIQFSVKKDKIHGLFANLAGFSLSLAIISYFLTAPNVFEGVLHLMTLIFVMGMSFMFGQVKKYKGIVQRMMYMGSYSWLLFIAFFYI